MKIASATGRGRGLLRPLGIGVGGAMLVAALAMPEVAGAADAWAGTTGGTEGQTSAWWWWPCPHMAFVTSCVAARRT